MDSLVWETKANYIRNRSGVAFLWFLTGGDFAPLGTSDNFLEAFLVAIMGECY